MSFQFSRNSGVISNVFIVRASELKHYSVKRNFNFAGWLIDRNCIDRNTVVLSGFVHVKIKQDSVKPTNLRWIRSYQEFGKTDKLKCRSLRLLNLANWIGRLPSPNPWCSVSLRKQQSLLRPHKTMKLKLYLKLKYRNTIIMDLFVFSFRINPRFS